MKKMLQFSLLFVGLHAFGQEEQKHDQITEGVFARNEATNTTTVGEMFFLKDMVGKKSAMSGILFGEQDNHGMIDVMAAAGPAISTKNATFGVMVGGSVTTSKLSLCGVPWVYAQTKNGKGSFFGTAVVSKQGMTFMVEGLWCLYTWKELEIAFGGINIQEFFGPYLRVSSGKMYFGVNVAYKLLPTISFGHQEAHHTSDIRMSPVVTEEKSGHYIQIVIGREVFGNKKANRCKDCDL